MDDIYIDIITHAHKIVNKYQTPDACKNEQELQELEDAMEVLTIDELATAARRTCEVDG